jgi:hypothetical protein
MKTYKIAFSLLLISLLSFNFSFAQKKRVGTLAEGLNEISGLAFINDSILVGHNDGGDGAKLYFMNIKGKLIHTTLVENATNIDWEDIAYDGKEFLYIADNGNNNNDRKDLVIYKVNIKDILSKKSVNSEKINISYNEQIAFPPAKSELYFDAESLSFYNNELYIFTKCRTFPFDGVSYCYVVPTKPGSYKLDKKYEITIGKDGWWKDSSTGSEFKDGKLYLLTYNRLLVYKFENGKFVKENEMLMEPISQFEAIAINKKGEIYIADENNSLLGGGNIYHVLMSSTKK